MCLPFQILVFALNKPLDGAVRDTRLHGLSPSYRPPLYPLNDTLLADVACQLEARRVGLHGNYVALLSTRQRALRDVVSQHQHHLPVVNMKVSAEWVHGWRM